MAAKVPASNPSQAASKCNFVAQDQIWKDHVKQEEVAAKYWPKNWNFLTTKYEDLVAGEIQPKEKRHKDVEPIEPNPVTPIEKYIKVDPSPQPYPRTTAQNIGWRSSHKDLALDKYGRYSKPKGGLVKQLNWPPEAIA